jgi:hypothetical protein
MTRDKAVRSSGGGVSRGQRAAAGFGLFAAVTALCLGLGVRAQSVTAQTPPPQFLRDIAPILDKKGCSTAGCHGKFGGRGGFQLSLLTLSPQDDYDPIARGARGRRVNLVEPEKSLLLLKATGQVGHGGGQRFARDSREYRLIRDWIAAGAPYQPDAEARLADLTVSPPESVLPKVGGTQKLRVLARFTDGTVRDVTSYANYESSDTAILAVDGNGVVTGKRWGGAAVTVRYLGDVKSASVVLPRADKTPYPKVRGSNFIDEYVQANLRKMNVVPSRLTTDREFARRVYLDVCGRLPEPSEVDAFVADSTLDKRAKLIDKLLDTPEYADVRTLRMGDLLRIHPRNLNNNIAGDRGAALLTEWVHDAVADNMPYDEFVRELILARGSTYRSGPANFYLVDRTPQDRMETIGQAFLGQRMACARCHKHPFDRWTTDDYWNFAAFMGKVAVRNGDLDGEREVYHNPAGRVINQSVTGARRGKPADPTFLGDAQPLLAKDGTLAAAPRPITARLAASRRPTTGTYSDGVSEGIDARGGQGDNLLERLAEWAVSPENPYFARATVNRLWSHYLGRGIVHPVDDMRATTPPSVPGLLDALAKDFVGHKYDAKHTIRVILNSRTYQTASDATATNALDDRFFSHFYPRPMMGQVLLDTLNQATGSNDRFGDFPVETKAAQLTLPVGSYFLDTFGRSHREFLAELEPKVEPTLVQTLHILNSPYIDNKVKANGGTVAALLKQKMADEELVTALYLKTVCRPPTAKEAAAALAYLKAATNRAEGVQDLMWALISAREFYFVS